MPDRAYLDWNATAPLRPEARAAMIEAMDVVGNPSSVHTEGRAAKMMVEKAREQVAALVGCSSEEVVFTSGATEANIACLYAYPIDIAYVSPFVHPSALEPLDLPESLREEFGGSECALVRFLGTDNKFLSGTEPTNDEWLGNIRFVLSHGDGETGVVASIQSFFEATHGAEFRATHLDIMQTRAAHIDITQTVGKNCSVREIALDCRKPSLSLSGHKIGGAKGVGAIVNPIGEALFAGGGQEKGRRSGTENVIGIAGFGAAAEAAQRDLDAGAWEPIAELRDDLESALRDCAGDDLTIFGEGAPRLPNTSCFAIPGWKGETQVMQLDLAGFAVSAGSACSSGKVGPSRVLKAMGFDDTTASSAIRVSMGPTTTKEEVARFIDAWTGLYQRMKARAA